MPASLAPRTRPRALATPPRRRYRREESTRTPDSRVDRRKAHLRTRRAGARIREPQTEDGTYPWSGSDGMP